MMMDDNMTIIDDNSPYIRYTLWKPHLAEPLLLEHLFISIFSIPNIKENFRILKARFCAI